MTNSIEKSIPSDTLRALSGRPTCAINAITSSTNINSSIRDTLISVRKIVTCFANRAIGK